VFYSESYTRELCVFRCVCVCVCVCCVCVQVCVCELFTILHAPGANSDQRDQHAGVKRRL
jgi:hypothetical protein